MVNYRIEIKNRDTNEVVRDIVVTEGLKDDVVALIDKK